MYKTVLSAKLHGIPVTVSELDYEGSCAIPGELMEAYGIEEYEQIHVYNINNGARFVTYAIPNSDTGLHALGASARQAMVGDKVIVVTYRNIPANENLEPKTKMW